MGAPLWNALLRAGVATLCFCGCAASTHESWRRIPVCDEVEPAPPEGRVLSADELASLALSGRLTPPEKVSGPDPFYTEQAIRHRVQGTIVVACRVMTNGCAMGCRVLQSLPYMDEQVLGAIRRRHYKPAMLDGTPVNIDYSFRITLRLPLG